MKGLKGKFQKLTGTEDKNTSFNMRCKESERISWEKVAKENGFTSTAAAFKFMMNKAEKNPEKIFG